MHRLRSRLFDVCVSEEVVDADEEARRRSAVFIEMEVIEVVEDGQEEHEVVTTKRVLCTDEVMDVLEEAWKGHSTFGHEDVQALIDQGRIAFET